MKYILAYIAFLFVLSIKAQSQPVPPPPYEADTISRPFSWPVQGAVWYYKNTGYNKDIDYIRVTPYKKYMVPYYDVNFGDTGSYPGKSLKFEMFSADGKLIKDSIVIYQQNYLLDIKDSVYSFDSSIYFYNGSAKIYAYFIFDYLNFASQNGRTRLISYLSRQKNSSTTYQIHDSFSLHINTKFLFGYNVTLNDLCMGQYDTVVWPIGSLKSFFPINECDYYEWGGSLLCYYDNAIDWYFRTTKEDCPCFRETNKDLIKGIYPNPFNHTIHISFYEIPAIDVFEIYDNLGKLVKTIENIYSLEQTIDLTGRIINIPYIQNGNIITINTENLPTGYMITRLYSNKSTYIIKFVKQ